MIEDSLRGFPNPLATPEEKAEKAYGLQYFKKMYSDWAGADGQLYASRKRRYEISRNYAEGTQSTSKYKKLLGNQGDLSYLSLDWSIVPVVPKFVDVIVGGLTNQDYKLKCSAIDKIAQDKKHQEKMEIAAKMMLQGFTKDLEIMTKIPLGGDQKLPADSEELDLHMQLNYKQAIEIAMEEGLELCMSLNDWKEIEKRIIRDLTAIGFGVSKTYSDASGVHLRYVDPPNFVVSHSNHPNFSDMEYGGELYRITIHELRRLAAGLFTDDQLWDIAQSVENRYGNGEVPRSRNSLSQVDDFRLEILDGEFMTSEVIRHEKKGNRFGGSSVRRKDSHYQPSKSSKYKREMLENVVEVVYTGKHIVGTEHVFDYGKAKNIIRPKSNMAKARMSYSCYMPNQTDLHNKSIVERMIPFSDQIQLAHLKIQQLIAKAKPKGAAIEIGALEGVVLGDGGEFTPLDLQDVYEATGNLYFRQQNEDGAMGNALPIKELSGGIGGALNELMAIVNYNMEQIRIVTGINEARDSSMPSSEALVGVQKLALLASNNATRGLNQAYLSILEGTAKSTALRIQHFVKYNKKYTGFAQALGEMNVKAIEVTADVSLHDFGIIIEALPDEEEKAIMEQNIQMSLSRDELRIEDAILLRTINNIKLANQMLILRRKKYTEEKQEMAQQNSEMNAQIQERSMAAKAQADAQTAQIKSQSDAQKLKMEYQLKEQFAQAEHQRKLEEIKMMGDIKTEHIEQASSDIDSDLTRIRTR